MSGTDDDNSGQRLSKLVAAFSERLAEKAEKSSAEIGESASAVFTQEKYSYERAAAEERIRAMAVSTNAKIQYMDLRKEYASRAFRLGECAVWFWGCMFIAVGIANGAQGKQILSDNALVTLTAGATVNVIAVCLVVVRGLFSKSEAEPAV